MKKIKNKVVTNINSRKLQFRESMLAFQSALAQEKQETIDMLITYKNISINRATKEEIKEANMQFCDLLKGAGLGVFAVLPFAPITLPIILRIGRKMGIELLPSAFIENRSNETLNENIELQEPVQSK